MHTRVEWLNLNLYVAQDNAAIAASLSRICQTIIRTSVFIIVPTLILIALFSMRLTQSIRKLTRKVQQSPVDSAPGDEAQIRQALSTTVTSTRDPEIHELELTFNNLMLKQRESTLNEISMREGTLQAQLSALQTQINPHFVYNTPNIISAKSMGKRATMRSLKSATSLRRCCATPPIPAPVPPPWPKSWKTSVTT